MSTPICDNQKYCVVVKEDGSVQAVVPLEVAERLEQRADRAESVLRAVRGALAGGWLPVAVEQQIAEVLGGTTK